MRQEKFLRFIRPGQRRWLFLLPVFFSLSCASSRSLQPYVYNLSVAGYYSKAAQVLKDDANVYGTKNQLLYFLDKGLIEHLEQNYSASIPAFASAQRKFDELYTHSISEWGTTWLMNDYSAPYRGEDFERVLINVFQAINYFALGKIEDALVEARDVDLKLTAINRPYKEDQKNVYREDAFARFLMGIFYEASGRKQDLNDAYISYEKALNIYQNDYSRNYDVPVPQILKENFMTIASWMGESVDSGQQQGFRDGTAISPEEKRTKAEVYLIHYNGYSPYKTQDWIPIPLPDGYVMSFAFPRYVEQSSVIKDSVLSAKDRSGNMSECTTELAENISSIEVQTLNNRKVRVLAKAVVRPIVKYAIVKQGEQQIRKKGDDNAAIWFKYFGSVFNLYTEQADLRSWQTLPGEIRIGRLLLNPGEYEFFVRNRDENHFLINEVPLGRMRVEAGQKKFLIIRTTG